MNDLELEMARNYGASMFLLYHTLKKYRTLTLSGLVVRSGLSETKVRQLLKTMSELNMIQRGGNWRGYDYSLTDCLNWKIQ
jgi:DNA-binding IclR family transcriptional regulator